MLILNLFIILVVLPNGNNNSASFIQAVSINSGTFIQSIFIFPIDLTNLLKVGMQFSKYHSHIWSTLRTCSFLLKPYLKAINMICVLAFRQDKYGLIQFKLLQANNTLGLIFVIDIFGVVFYLIDLGDLFAVEALVLVL